MVPLVLVAVAVERDWKKLWSVIPFAVAAAGYFFLAFSGRAEHLHFNDGTFSLSAPFLEVLFRSTVGLLWVWGILMMPILATPQGRTLRPILVIAGLWIIVTLLPYSFLTYMKEVPSRHTYLASVGRSLILAAGFLTLFRIALARHRPWLVPLVAIVFITHQCVYLWTVKHRQYSNRAEPTEQLIRAIGEGQKPIYAKCFPYSPAVAELALRLTSSEAPPFHLGAEAAKHPGAIDFCNKDANGVHY
jgi:hypothetical protein